MRVPVLVEPRSNEEPALPQVADDLVGGVAGRRTVEPAVVLVEPSGLVDRTQNRQPFPAAEVEILLPRTRRDVNDPGPLVERDLVPSDDAVLDVRGCRQVVVRPPVAPADELFSADDFVKGVVRIAGDGDPLAVLPPPVLGRGIDRGDDIRRQRPRRRRPDDEVLVRAVEQREADEEGRVGTLLVDAGLRQLMLRERRPASWTPLRRAVTEVQPTSLVDDLEEPPDVFVVGVAEGEVVVPPVHPLAEALAAARQLLG